MQTLELSSLGDREVLHRGIVEVIQSRVALQKKPDFAVVHSTSFFFLLCFLRQGLTMQFMLTSICSSSRVSGAGVMGVATTLNVYSLNSAVVLQTRGCLVLEGDHGNREDSSSSDELPHSS